MRFDPNCKQSGLYFNEIQYPVAECGAQALGAKFANKFHGEIVLNAKMKKNKLHSHVSVVIFKVWED